MYADLRLCAFFVVPGSFPNASSLEGFWSYSKSPGRFPSRRSHYRRRPVQVEAEQTKCLQNDVATGVFIAVPAIPTIRIGADKDTISKRQIGFARPATVTKLAGGKKAIDFEQHPALSCHFALQQVQQFADGCIRKRAREATVADQAFHMQIFYRDNPAGRGDLGGEFV